jgi:hypothetical protein
MLRHWAQIPFIWSWPCRIRNPKSVFLQRRRPSAPSRIDRAGSWNSVFLNPREINWSKTFLKNPLFMTARYQIGFGFLFILLFKKGLFDYYSFATELQIKIMKKKGFL